MPLGNAYVKRTVGHDVLQLIHRTAHQHGGRDAHNARILLRQFHQRLAKDVLEERRLPRIIRHITLTRLRIEASGSVPRAGVFFRRGEAFPLHRV